VVGLMLAALHCTLIPNPCCHCRDDDGKPDPIDILGEAKESAD
jgi:hypothetical protein